MRIIALDPGYDRCGVAVIDQSPGGSPVLVASGCITTNPSDVFEDRLTFVVSEFRAWIQHHSPDVCALERLFFTRNQKTAMRVAETRGALIVVAHEAGMPVHEFGPGQIKVAVTGSGRAAKKQVMMMVDRIMKLDKKTRFDDEYDAIAVGITAGASLRHGGR